jgi:hypothetical protein
MKRFILLSLIILSACNKEHKADSVPTVDIPLKRIEKVFLDYEFGMSKPDFKKHTDSLKSSGKLDKKGRYSFNIENFPSKTYILPEYHEGKLWKLILITELDKDAPIQSNTSLFLKLTMVFMQKYHGFEKILDGMAYEKIEGNLKIELIDNIYNPTINYIDLPIEDTINSIKTQEQSTQESKIKNDI